MAARNAAATIIIKKVKKGGHGHHGGAWKVAYADFVTAMMAFFLLLWLLNATSEDQKKGISDYFAPATASTSKSGAGGILGGQTISSPGALVSRNSPPSVTIELKPTSGDGDKDSTEKPDLTKQEMDEAIAQREEELFKEKEKELREAIEKDPDLKGLAKNLLIDQTPEGLRIQLVDRDGQPMFPSGSVKMFDRTRKLLAQVAKVVQTMPNKLSISGHTDATPFRSSVGASYGNWELSSDRAHASRRELMEDGVPAARISRVVGRADTEPLTPENPTDPQNRRISIVLIRDAVAKGAAGGNGAAAPAQRPEVRRDWSGPRVR
ncbi:MAG: flagellar motor protein MotB [Rhodospirillales bacterium]